MMDFRVWYLTAVVPGTTVKAVAAPEQLEFVYLPSFMRSAVGLLDDNELRRIELEILRTPVAGPVIVGTGGVRKLRVALSGGGKRGGARLIYFFREAKGRIEMKQKRKEDLTVGQEIIAGLEQALAYERGELAHAKVTRATLSSQRAEIAPVPAYRAKRIVALRKTLRLSQPVFATALNVSAETVKKWEQGTREPEGAALRLLELAEEHPQWIIDRVNSRLR